VIALLGGPGKAGDTLVLRGQRYVFTGLAPYTRKDGKPTHLAAWRSACADCGSVFDTLSTVDAAALNRRCSTHRKPGVRVKKRRAV
jgi:hypothetical protein